MHSLRKTVETAGHKLLEMTITVFQVGGKQKIRETILALLSEDNSECQLVREVSLEYKPGNLTENLNLYFKALASLGFVKRERRDKGQL